MRDGLEQKLRESGYSLPGFAAAYDAYRPRPPVVLLDLLPQLARIARPALVVDLGSGSGLSTRFWAERADAVLGVEPNAEMRAYAVTHTDAPNVRYVDGSSYDVPVADGAADLVTASQSLQWMEPHATFVEVARVLRPGGVFAAYNYVDLATPHWEPEAEFHALRERVRRLREERGLAERKRLWPAELARLEESGAFRRTRELAVHSVEHGNADRLVGFALSEGSLRTLLEAGATEADVGLDRLREVAARALGDDPAPWYLTYRVWLGLK